MKLDGFRELLAKRAQDVSLQNLVKFMKDEILADLVVESLEKMARSSHKGDSANFAIRDFGTEMDPAKEPNMIHDALSHHVSHYKSALDSGNKTVANQHAKQVFRLVDMADQAQKHSHGKLQVEAVSPHAWERNGKTNKYTADDDKVKEGAYKPGEFKTKTKGWRHRGSDYSFLQQAPHESYSQEIRRHGHDNAYPMEQIKVNGKHVDVEKVDPKDKYESHPFDSHPVMKHFEEPAGGRTPERDKQYTDERDKYESSPELDKYFESQESREKTNPEAYQKRGSEPSEPVHKQVTPLNLDREKTNAPSNDIKQTKNVETKQPSTKTQLSPEDRQAMLDKLPPELQAKFARLFEDEGK